ncbi:MAG: heavy metal-binding domain-containing protein [Chitinophagales bacterium]|jgi:hypothetical protein
MKNAILLLALNSIILLGACNSSSNRSEKGTLPDSTTNQGQNTSQNFNIDTTMLKNGEAFYQCAMNLEVLSDKPGDCPKCGMELSEMKKH